jgi:DNA-binding IclR family transcriptional regulator
MPEQSKTVDKALAVLVALGEGGPASVSDLARRAGLSRTAALRLLTSLDRQGFVRRTGDGYTLGLALLQLSLQIEPVLRRAARPVLEDLAGRFGETALLAVRDGDDAVAVDQVLGTGHRVTEVRYRPGYRHPLTVAAHGRAILAFLPGAPADALDPDLAEARRRGYVFSSGELEPGAAGLAAPVLDGAGAALASIGVVAPDHRLPDLDELAAAVCRAAHQVERELARANGSRSPSHSSAMSAPRGGS